MGEMKAQANWWWLEDDQSSGKRSTWLQSTISALNGKTTAMLKLIEEDADSFAKRAEMYYKKRPELIRLVEDFYRAHRSLAERYDLVKSEPGSRLLKSQLFAAKSNSEKLTCSSDQRSECSSYEAYVPDEDDDPTESEVDDPEVEDETHASDSQGKEEEGSENEEGGSSVEDEEVERLREEVERLKEANSIQRVQLILKDEEKREVIRQLSMTVEALKVDNVKLRRLIAARDSRNVRLK